ncbi:hypothetical protein ES703_60571 [subsurface metagenome]
MSSNVEYWQEKDRILISIKILDLPVTASE